MSLPEVPNVVLLKPGGGGKKDIGQFRRRREEKVDHREELYLL